MGIIIHKKTEFLGEAVVCTNVYMSVSEEEVSITQDIYYNDRIAHKNNVMMDVDDLIHILQRAKGCIMGDHHAYDQPENDDEEVITLVVGGKSFQCTIAQYHQAKEFIEMVSVTGAHYEMIVHGDGLISYLINNPEIFNGEVK